MSIQRAKFKVAGMYCTTCKPIVEKQLKGEEAIKGIDLDYMTDSVVVEYDSDSITKIIAGSSFNLTTVLVGFKVVT